MSQVWNIVEFFVWVGVLAENLGKQETKKIQKIRSCHLVPQDCLQSCVSHWRTRAFRIIKNMSIYFFLIAGQIRT